MIRFEQLNRINKLPGGIVSDLYLLLS